jgi:hypothetical protein
MRQYIFTKDDIQQEFLAFAHFMQQIEEDWHNGDGGEYANRVGQLANRYAGRVAEPEKTEFPSANWNVIDVREAGRLGGTSRTEKKVAASRRNGRKGGRPRKLVGAKRLPVHPIHYGEIKEE